MGLAVCRVGRAGCRHHGIGTAGSGETGGFGKASEFNGHFAGAVNFKNRFG